MIGALVIVEAPPCTPVGAAGSVPAPFALRPAHACIDMPRKPAYHQSMRKHTTIDLDRELVGEARQVLGTTTTTETIHAALAEVVRSRRRMAILELHPALTLADLDAMRAHRFAEDPAPYRTDVTPE